MVRLFGEVTLVLSHLAIVKELGEQLLGGTRGSIGVRTIQLLLQLRIREKTWQCFISRFMLLRRVQMI